ncbi:MAG: hypothetical protein ACXAC2_19525, partial [Candidatus Kariarchaeaceae archaeon]
FTIIGRKELNNYLHDLVNQANQDILLATDTLVELRYADIISMIQNKSKIDSINLKLLTMPRGIDNIYEKEIADELEDVDIHVADYPFGTILLVVDNEASIFINYGVHDDIRKILKRNLSSDELDKLYLEREKNYVGFFILDEKIASMYTHLFNLAWDQSESYQDYQENDKEVEKED